jgi:hypothetical protein
MTPKPPLSPRAIRELMGLSVEDAATGARCSSLAVLLFEDNALSVADKTRQRLVTWYLKLWGGIVRVAAVVDGARAP